MTKPKTHSLQKPIKKKHTKEDIERLLPPEESSQLEQPKKRLKKHRKHDSEDQDFVLDASDADYLEDQKYEAENEQFQEFQRFKIQNDDDIQEQKNKLEQNKKNKKLKNNQQIDKLLKKMETKQKKQVTKKKQQVQVQSNIHDFFKKKHEQKKKAQRQPTPQVSEDSAIDDEDISDGQLLRRTVRANENLYNKFQGNVGNVTEKQLMERALKQSLKQAKKQHTKIQEEQHVDINDFNFQNLHPPHQHKNVKPKSPHKDTKKPIHHQVHQKMEIQKPKQKHEIKKHQLKPAIKKASAKNSKQPNEGPLGNETIVFTGEFQPYSKDQLIELCQKLGANVPKSFTKGVTVLFQGLYVVNEWKKRTNQDIKTTGKSQQAQKRGTRIAANDDLNDYFLQKTGKTLEEHFRKNPQKLDGFVEKEGPAKENEKMEVEIVDPNFAQKRKDSANFGVLWTEKYKPNTLDEVIGQGSQIKQLRQWLQDWEDVVLRGNKKDVVPARGFLQAGTINSRAALLSGDPGLGKTTTARLLAQELGYKVAQFNASDIRNKKGVQLLETNSISLDKQQVMKKTLIIMDEVDGMSKGDRGGISEIINMIKKTTVPIICICNDRQSQKIRSLAGHCFDIRFHKPHKQLIVKRLNEIIKKEGGQASDLYLSRLVETFQNDMRQILNYLELAFNTKAAQVFQIKDANKLSTFTKDNAVMLSNFDAAKKLLNRQDDMPLRQRMQCYFIDSDFVPLMVHENYLSSMKKGKLTKGEFHKLVKANEGFVLSDLIDTRIRKDQDWSLMPAAGYMSSVYPSLMVAESIGFPQFPSWLGKFSSERKHKRLLKQLKQAIHCEYPSTLKSIRYGMAEVLYQEFNYLLKHDKVEETLDLMETYGLTPLSLNEVLLQVQYNPQKNILLPDVSTSTKTKLTKAFNRRHQEAKMKGKVSKGAAPQPEHHKYNEVLDEMSDDDFINDEDQELKNTEESDMIDENKNKNKKKATKAGMKKK